MSEATTLRPVGTLRGLFFYNDWARDQVLDSASALDDAALDRPFDMGPGSLRATLGHIWRNEQHWLARWQEAPAPELPERLSIAELRERGRETARERNGFIDGVGEAGEARRVSFRVDTGEECAFALGDMMLHVCNHGVHHRAQALNMMRHLGIEKPPGIDYLFLKLADAPQPAVTWDRDTIAEYFAYGDWAWGLVHEAAATLEDEPLDRAVEMGLGSLRRTLTHCYDAETWWLANWSGEPPEAFQELSADISISRLRQLVADVTARRNAYVAGCSNDDLQREVTASPGPGRQFTFRLGDTMTQMCTHGTHHRAQALNLLRRFGAPVQRDNDYIDWVYEH